MTWLILGVATLVSCVIVRRLPILEQFRGATSYARRSLRLIVNTAISDHWKERVLPRYAWRLARNSLSGFGLMLLALAPFIFLAGVDQLWPQGILQAMLGWRGFACIMAVAILYLTLVRFWPGDKAGSAAAKQNGLHVVHSGKRWACCSAANWLLVWAGWLAADGFWRSAAESASSRRGCRC